MIVMDVRSAELTKYAANAMLATKISFMNELANIAERYGRRHRAGARRHRLRPAHRLHLHLPGCGYGGSCFPKDVHALVRSARGEYGYDAQLVKAVEGVNNRQKQVLFRKISAHFGRQPQGQDDRDLGPGIQAEYRRHARGPGRVLMEALWAAGARVRAYDPQAMAEARRIYGERPDLVLCDDADEALDGADALVIVTEWQEFRSPDFETIRQTSCSTR